MLSYDYNFDFVATDQVFVVTAGGIGSFPGDGESSYFFGLVSSYPPVTKTGWVYTDAGWVTVNVYAPQVP
ncbi:MAG: hypothetical protein ACXW5U_19155 [Thermoanaerobaculia bacterium]